MVNISKSENSIKFVFTDSDHYLYGNGEIEVPVNSLLLVIDESDMVTFKKLSGDPFLSFRADNSNLGTKAAIEQFYKDNMVGSTGGASGVTPSEVQEMIDESISGKADTSAVTQSLSTKQDALEFYSENEIEDSETGETDKYGQIEVADELNGAHVYADYFSTNEEKSPYASIDAWVNDGEGNEKQNRVYADADGVGISADENADDGEGNIVHTTSNVSVSSTEIGMNVGEEGDTSTTLLITSTSATLNGDAIATEPYVDAALSGKADTSAVTAAIDAAITGKVDTSAITTAITSGSTDDEIPTAKAVYDAIPTGGGATYSAGYGINIDTANTISFNMPITCTTSNNNSITIGNGTNNGNWSLLVGNDMSITRSSSAIGLCTNDMSSGGSSISGNTRGILIGCSNSIKGGNVNLGGGVAIGDRNQSTDGGIVIGTNSKASGSSTVAIGLSVDATGTTKMNLNNQIKVDTNNQVYIKDKTNTTDVCIQDAIAALGGLKFVQCTQSEYDSMVSGGTVDSSTIYFITNVVS